MKEEYVLSSIVKSRDAWTAIADHIEHDDLSEQGWVLWECVSDYYSTDGEAQHVDPELLEEAAARRVSADKHKTLFRDLVKSICAKPVSPANVVEDFLANRKERLGQELAAALLRGDTPRRLVEEYTALMDQTSLGSEEDTEIRQGYGVEQLCSVDHNPDNLIQVWPDSLNRRLDGGVKPGHHIVLFARPEMGKTLTVINMIAGFLSQGLLVLYIGNEDPISDINMRVVNRLTGMNKFEVLNAPKKADTKAREQNYENLILAALAPGTPREIGSLIEKYKPDVLVIDQLRNLNMHQDNFVLKLEQAATQARQWAKRYSCVVVSVVQAGDSATGKAILDLGDVDYSNTGIPAQADLMLGLGGTDANLKRGEIVFSMPKNKISGIHDYFAVLTEPNLSQLIPLD